MKTLAVIPCYNEDWQSDHSIKNTHAWSPIMELNPLLYYFTVPGMTGHGRWLNIVNAGYQGYDHGS